IFALGGYAQPSKGPDRSHFVYDIKKDKWSVKSKMITPRSNFVLVSAEDKIFAIGGDKFLDKAERYDINSDKWTELPAMPTKRQHIFGDIYEKNIYVAGGLLCWKCKAEEQLTAKMEVYNISKKKWSALPDMPTPRQNPLVSVVGGHIYVIGGMDNTKVIPSVEVFDLQTQTWEKRADIPEPGFFSGSVVYKNKIYILDGAEKTESKTDVLVYDPAQKKWTKATPLPYPVKLAGFTLSENKLYVVGGCDSGYKAYKSVFCGTIID
ncbi:MAG: kelch repeat-containing protein, partial [Acidobacteriota bacterium]